MKMQYTVIPLTGHYNQYILYMLQYTIHGLQNKCYSLHLQTNYFTNLSNIYLYIDVNTHICIICIQYNNLLNTV